MCRLPYGILAVVVSLALLNVQKASAAPPLKSDPPGPMVRLPGHVLPALAQAKAAASQPKAADEPLTLTLVLKRNDQAGFDCYLHDVYDPKSPNYRHFLTQSELSDRFGPSRAAYDGVLDYLQDNGFTLVEGSANRLTLTVRGTRAVAERAFDVHLGDYRIGDNRFFANDVDPALPSDIAWSVQSVAGLSNLAKVSLHHGPVKATQDAAINLRNCANDPNGFGTQPACGLGYFFVAIFYDVICIVNDVTFGIFNPDTTNRFCSLFNPFPTPPKASSISFISQAYAAVTNVIGVAGIGQKIGLLEFDSFHMSDVADFLAFAGASPSQINQLSEVKVNGGAPVGANESEVLLDIDTVMLLAPRATYRVYDAPFAGAGVSFQTLFNRMITDGMTIISNSWAYCEDQTTLADVQSIDSILQSAAAAGISVFNGAGDTGSTCLDGAANTVAVPADSPNATAVGGSSAKLGPGGTYLGETWWNGINATPPTGQGGFGVSKFFSRPNYQGAFTASPNRSVPDVVANADPATGVMICQASAGGCPSGLLYGGTSFTAPLWAAFTALLNEAQGDNLGFLNPLIYPLAGTNAFHSAASMGSDFAHVGIGSPNLSFLNLALRRLVPGLPSGELSNVSGPFRKIPADGSSGANVIVQLRDPNGSFVSGKTVTLAASAGSHAVITPSSGVTTVDNGTVVFEVTDLTPETVTFTATDTSDGIALDQKPNVTFAVPPAASAGINAFPTAVTANGIATTTITVTLKDALNRPTPGKLITLSQGNGHSLITGPNPSVTDNNGQIQFTATNLVNEVVTYTAVDVTDGDLPVPGNTQVTFTNGSGGACGQNTPPPVGLNGYTITPFATGFATGALFFGNINFGACSGVATPAFLNGNVYLPNFFNGDVFKFGAGGGAVSNANKLTTIGPTLSWPVVGKDGRLYAIRVATHASPPNFTDGAILELDPNTGAVLRTVAANLPCSEGLVVDPLSGDLFFDDQCFGAGFDPSLFRVRNPSSANPTVEVYATLPFITNGQIVFSPKGTIYVVSNYNQQSPPVIRVSGTNGPQPPTVTQLPGVVSNYWLNIGNVDATGEAKTLITLANGKLQLTDITTNPPTITATLTDNIGGGIIGPDGCLYMPNQNVLYKLTDPTGGCSFLPTNATPAITLTPTAVSPNPAQGTAQTFTATIRNVTVPADTPVFFMVTGANPRFQLVRTNASGQASFSYTAISEGRDTIVATATVNNAALTSNKAQVTWAAGKHVTFLTLNLSPKAGSPGQPINVMASLTDSSLDPPAPVFGATIDFTLGSAQCFGATNVDGIATCQLVTSRVGMDTLTATFAGTSQLVESSAAVGFNLVALPSRALRGDLNCDGDVDQDDLNILLRNLNKPVSQSACGHTVCGTSCDLDGDGKITALDSRKLVLLCTRPRCATH